VRILQDRLHLQLRTPNKLFCTSKLVLFNFKLIAAVCVLQLFSFLTLDVCLFHSNEEWRSSLLNVLQFAQKPTSTEVSYIRVNICTCTSNFVTSHIRVTPTDTDLSVCLLHDSVRCLSSCLWYSGKSNTTLVLERTTFSNLLLSLRLPVLRGHAVA
jgi:hypothetical protein